MNDSCLSYFYSALLYGGLHFGTEVKCLESTSTFLFFAKSQIEQSTWQSDFEFPYSK